MTTRKEHWENIYNTKNPEEVSWTQDVPQTSLDFIDDLNVSKSAAIIDIGGGDSKLVDYLLDRGFTNVSVLDISEKSVEKAKQRLGKKAEKVKWIISDILDYNPAEKYEIWHDRAAFHFLTEEWQTEKYRELVSKVVTGHLIIGVFSEEGPTKCSGLEIKQYDSKTLFQRFEGFKVQRCLKVDHTTPFNTTQNFLFCHFQKI